MPSPQPERHAPVQDRAVSVRDAEPADHPAVREVLAAAYRQFASAARPSVFEPYLANILDVEARARTGRLLVAERAGRILGTVTFYPDPSAFRFGWPRGWAYIRALGVDPATRGQGVGRLLMEACLDRARRAGAPVLCLHTAEFMAAAIALYERMGFRRTPAFDFDAAKDLGGGKHPAPFLAYRLGL
jgi:ribosomal protein S18 acetylase RimI-like enzyme